MNKVYKQDKAPFGQGFTEGYDVRYYFKYLSPDGKMYQSKDMIKSYLAKEKNMHEEVQKVFLEEIPYAHIISITYL